MLSMAGIAGAAALALVTPAVAPPPAPGAWHQLGAAPTSRPGKPLRFYRTAQNPKAVGIVVRSSSARKIRLSWSSYCEFESDDAQISEDQGTATGVHSVAAYPPVLPAATLCYVWVNARIAGTGRIVAAEFAY
jgi:hypothetical protein